VKWMEDGENAGLVKITDRDMQIQVNEGLERDKRKMNLVLMGVPEERDNEAEFIREVFKALLDEGERPKYTIMERVGRVGDKMRPVRVAIDDWAQRRKLLSKAKILKNISGMERIYIAPDLTRKQQEDDKVLRDKVKGFRSAGEQKVRIERGSIVAGEGEEKKVLYKGQ
jgi:hypothetical protein